MKTSIKTKTSFIVIVSIGSVAASLLIIGFISVWRMHFDTIGQRQKQDADIFADFIAQQVEHEVGDIKSHIGSPWWQDAVKKANLGYATWEPKAIQEYMKRRDEEWISASTDAPFVQERLGSRMSQRLKVLAAEDATIAEMFLTDKYGGLVAASNKTSDFYQADETWWQRAYNNGKGDIFLGEIEWDESSRKISMAIAIPFKDETGQVIGVAKTALDIDVFFQPLAKYAFGKTGHVALYDDQGRVIYHAGFKTMSKMGLSGMELDRILKSKNGFSIIEPPCLKIKAIVSMVKVRLPLLEASGNNWIVVVTQARNEIFLPLYRIFGVGLILTLIITLLMMLIMRSVIGDIFILPLQKIRDGLLRFAGGQQEYKIDLKTGDEIEDLADVFNQMTGQLEKITVSKDYLDTIMGSMTDSLIVVDQGAKIATVNKTTCTLLGYEEKELIGKDVSLLFPEEEEEEEEEEIPLKGTKFKKLLEEGTLSNYEITYKAKDGRKIFVIISGAVLKRQDCPQGGLSDDCPSFKEKGMHCEKILGVVCVARDITARMKEEEKLTRALQEEIRNQKFMISMLEDNNQIREKLEKQVKELEVAQNMLVQSEKMAAVGQLSAGIAHEINNPLGYISSNLSTLEQYVENSVQIFSLYDTLKNVLGSGDIKKAMEIKEQIVREEEAKEMAYIRGDISNLIRESKEGVGRIRSIIFDLKLFSRKDQGEEVSADINEIMDKMINMVWNEIKYKVDLQKEYGQLPLVKCNRQQIGQVFVNLLVNAAQAIKEKGIIAIRTYQAQEQVFIEMSDTGEGIPQESINKIFDPFFTTKEVGKGTGLGLFVTHEIVAKHGGAITVESVIGKGTMFVVSLPVKES